MVPAPERSREQRMVALQHANEVRVLRKEDKARLREGKLTPRDVMVLAHWQSAKLRDLLVALPRVGGVKAQKILNRVRCSPSKTIGGLSERQRDEVLRELSPPDARRR